MLGVWSRCGVCRRGSMLAVGVVCVGVVCVGVAVCLEYGVGVVCVGVAVCLERVWFLCVCVCV